MTGLWDTLTRKLWDWYKHHDGDVDAHHTKYTDGDARGAVGDTSNPCNSVYIDSSNLGDVGNHKFEISPNPSFRNFLTFQNTTLGERAKLEFGVFEVRSFNLNRYAYMHKAGISPYWFKFLDGTSGQIRLSHIGSIALSDDALIKDLKNHGDAVLSGTPKVVEIEIAGTPYYFKVYPTKT